MDVEQENQLEREADARLMKSSSVILSVFPSPPGPPIVKTSRNDRGS